LIDCELLKSAQTLFEPTGSFEPQEAGEKPEKFAVAPGGNTGQAPMTPSCEPICTLPKPPDQYTNALSIWSPAVSPSSSICAPTVRPLSSVVSPLK